MTAQLLNKGMSMLQNNPLKSDIEQMNDWEAFKEHIQHSVDKQVVSNKTVIMILFIASSAFHLLTITLALIAFILVLILNRDLASTQRELSEFTSQMKEMQTTADNAKRAYDNARQTLSRSRN